LPIIVYIIILGYYYLYQNSLHYNMGKIPNSLYFILYYIFNYMYIVEIYERGYI